MASDRDGRPDRVRILLDTNALMLPGQFGIDLFDELLRLCGRYEPMTLTDVLRELEGIARGRGRDAAAARLGLQLCERCRLVESEGMGGTVDEKVMQAAEASGSVVVTNDRGLRDALLERGVDVIVMRGQKKLELIRG
ncbi:MAG: nucleotide-binding protein [Methanomicrobiales archaeon]|nr:nucleotide-binding protein [Methanomicrobiales archaeon]MDI6876849.1 nucleotide-binding protein [Methanomicrobiales archaeon]